MSPPPIRAGSFAAGMSRRVGFLSERQSIKRGEFDNLTGYRQASPAAFATKGERFSAHHMIRRTGTTSRGFAHPSSEAETISSTSSSRASFGIGKRRIRTMTVTSSPSRTYHSAQRTNPMCDDIAHDVRRPSPRGRRCIPILSRTDSPVNLRGTARGVKKVVLQLSYPSDEVGNT